jgi:hypothetical protein
MYPPVQLIYANKIKKKKFRAKHIAAPTALEGAMDKTHSSEVAPRFSMLQSFHHRSDVRGSGRRTGIEVGQW